MKETRINRRQVLKVGAAASLPLIAGQAASARGETSGNRPKFTIGISTLGFRDLSNAQVAETLANAGVKVTQLFLTQKDSPYWKYNSRSDLSKMTPQRCREIAETYRSAGVEIHSIGVYTNLIHPEASEREANLAYFEAMMQVARRMGVATLVTEAGHYHPEKPSNHPYHFQTDTWNRMVTTGKRLAQLAEQYQMTVLLEPYFLGFLASAKRTRLFLEEVDSQRIRALLDPANLLEVDDLETMFSQLGPWIDCFHAKDRKLHVPRGVAAGKGDLDYPKFLKLVAKHYPDTPLILEYVGSGDYEDALKHLKSKIASI